LSELKLLITEGVIIPVYSQELLQEFLQVAQRQKCKRWRTFLNMLIKNINRY